MTSHRFTLNDRGAMLGWEMSPDQLGDRPPRCPRPGPGMYLVGQWTRPGGGITPVIVSAMRVARLVVGGHSAERDFGKRVSRRAGSRRTVGGARRIAARRNGEGPPMSRSKRWMRRVLLTLAIICPTSATGLAYLRYHIKREDAEHARFLDCGQSINLFLKTYADQLVKAHRRGDPPVVLASYSDDFYAPRRGHWRLQKEQDLGTATVVASARRKRRFNRGALAGELAAYLEGISSIQSVKCKIDLIEHAAPDRSAVITVKYVLDGEDQAGRLIEDRFFFRWRLERVPLASGLSDWRIISDELVAGERVAGRGDAFLRPDRPRSEWTTFTGRDPKLDPHPVEAQVRRHPVRRRAASVPWITTTTAAPTSSLPTGCEAGSSRT